jgi:predicted nucleic acid-binding protein
MIFLDTTVLVGAADARDRCHADGRATFEALARGALRQAFTSDLVLAETATILAKRRGAKAATAFVEGLRDEGTIQARFLDAAAFDGALRAFARFAPALSFADCATVALMSDLGCRTLFSHDEGFDRIPGLTRRTAPA